MLRMVDGHKLQLPFEVAQGMLIMGQSTLAAHSFKIICFLTLPTIYFQNTKYGFLTAQSYVSQYSCIRRIYLSLLIFC